MKSICLLTALGAFALSAFAQQKTQRDKEKEFDRLVLVNSDDDTGKFITNYVFNEIAYEKQRGITGTEIKEGKNASSSATIDDKSITVNLSFNPIYKRFYLQPTIAATAKKGFADIVSEKKYSRTLTGGMNFQFFFNKSSGGFSSANRVMLHNKLRALKKFNDTDSIKKYFDTTVKSATGYFSKNKDYVRDINSANPKPRSSFDSATVAAYNQYLKEIDTLIKTGILSEDFSSKSIADQQSEIDNAKSTSQFADIAETQFLKETETLQKAAKWNTFSVKWISGGMKYNMTSYPVLDYTAKSYSYDFKDEYISAFLSFNYLDTKYRSGYKFYVSPTVNFVNSRKFDEDKLVKSERNAAYAVGTDTLNRTTKSFEFYEKIADRLYNVYFECPFMFYWPKSSVGFEVAFKAGVNDADDDNVGGRIGLFVPVGTKEDKPMLIEPLVRFKKLFSSASNDFVKDNIVFGFNINVSIPSFMNEKKAE